MNTTQGQRLPDWLRIIGAIEGLVEPTGIAVFGQDILLVDHAANDVFRLGPQGGVKARYSQASPSQPLQSPHGILALETGFLVADTLHNRIVRLDPELVYENETTECAGQRLRRPHALASNRPNEWFLVDTDNSRLIHVDDGKNVVIAAVGNRSLGLLKPCGLCLSARQIFVADTYHHRLVVIDRDGQSVRTYGVHGSAIGAFRYPVAVASWQDWFVVSDEFNKRLQLWRADDEGDYWTAACVSSNLCAPWLGKPFGVVFNPDGLLFIADRARAQVLVVHFEEMLKASAYEFD